MSGKALVLRADAMRLPLPDESVDLIVSSPPYFALRSYRDGDEHYTGQIGSEPTPQAFLEALWAVMHECWRVLKPTGSCFINLGDKRSGSGGHNNASLQAPGNKHAKAARLSMMDSTGNVVDPGKRATRRNAPDRYNQAAFGRAKSKMLLPHRFAIGCEDGLASPCACPEMSGYRCPPGMHRADKTCVLHGRCRTSWIMRQDVVWQKLNGLPESVTDRCRDSHEYLFHFTKEGRYFAAVDEVREPQIHPNGTQAAGVSIRKQRVEGLRSYDGQYDAPNPLGKLPGSVWALPSEPLIISDEVKAHYGLPDHFAAFPTELVRRVILGWSPSGVCVECNKARFGTMQRAQSEEKRPISASDQGDRGLHRLRENEREVGLRSQGQGDEALSGLPAQGSSNRQSGRRSDEVRRALREMPHAEALGRGDERAAERAEEAALLLREAVDGSGDVQHALLEVEEERRSARPVRQARLIYVCDCTPYTDHPGNGAGSGRTYSEAVAQGKPYERDEMGWDARQPLDKRPKSGGWREYHVDGWTPPPTKPAVCLDIFGGTGTTAGVARALGRIGVSVDLSMDYSRLARWRIERSGHFTKVVNRTNSENQGDLFGVVA